MATYLDDANQNGASLRDQVRGAIFWRSGAQIVAQTVSWASTLLVVRLLVPADYGLFAMTSTVVTALNVLNGTSVASALVREASVTTRQIRQAFALLLLLNGALAAAQFAAAPAIAAYYGHPVIAAMLRWQCLLFLMTPFLSVPEALLIRRMEFRTQAIITIGSTACGAATAIGFALSGGGVWTLVAAPVVIFGLRTVAMVAATRFYLLPLFDFRGSRAMLGFGGTLMLSQLFWIVQTQSDVLIAGRRLPAGQLGLYTEALFLTQIVATKFVPPLNEVAFPAFARLQHDPGAMAWSLMKAVRLVFLVVCPIYFGMAVTAGPAVASLFGMKWLAMAPLVATLALAMPFVTLQILFFPPLNALGHAQVAARASAAGAVIMPVTFLIAARWGPAGLSASWLVAYPLLFASTFSLARRYLPVTVRGLTRAVAPGLAAAAAMALVVRLADILVVAAAETVPAPVRLVMLGALGASVYAGLLWWQAPETARELLAMLCRRPARN